MQTNLQTFANICKHLYQALNLSHVQLHLLKILPSRNTIVCCFFACIYFSSAWVSYYFNKKLDNRAPLATCIIDVSIRCFKLTVVLVSYLVNWFPPPKKKKKRCFFLLVIWNLDTDKWFWGVNLQNVWLDNFCMWYWLPHTEFLWSYEYGLGVHRSVETNWFERYVYFREIPEWELMTNLKEV